MAARSTGVDLVGVQVARSEVYAASAQTAQGAAAGGGDVSQLGEASIGRGGGLVMGGP